MEIKVGEADGGEHQIAVDFGKSWHQFLDFISTLLLIN